MSVATAYCLRETASLMASTGESFSRRACSFRTPGSVVAAATGTADVDSAGAALVVGSSARAASGATPHAASAMMSNVLLAARGKVRSISKAVQCVSGGPSPTAHSRYARLLLGCTKRTSHALAAASNAECTVRLDGSGPDQ